MHVIKREIRKDRKKKDLHKLSRLYKHFNLHFKTDKMRHGASQFLNRGT